MMNRRLAYKPLFQALIFFAFTLYFAGVVISGAVYRYVHERHIPMLLFSIVFFLLIGILKVKQALKDTQSGIDRTSFYSIFIFAAALGLMTVKGAKNLDFSKFTYTEALGDQSAVSPAPAFGIQTSPQLTLKDGCIVMDDENFSLWLTELYTNLGAWAGTKIRATGSVWKDEELFEPNEFALARMMMVCCAADLQPIGILAQWNNTQALSDGAWIKVTGTLTKKNESDSDPLILIETIETISPPEREYVYP